MAAGELQDLEWRASGGLERISDAAVLENFGAMR